jgi:hypothetical protein
MRVLWVFALFTNLLLSFDQNTTNYGGSHESSFETLMSSNSFETNATLQVVDEQQNILLSYKNFPKSVFTGEVFKIEYETIIAKTDYSAFKTEFMGGNDSEVLNPNSNWKWFSDNIFYNTFYFKCSNELANLPDLKFSIINENNTTSTKIIEAQDIQILPLIENRSFCGVLARSMQIKNSSVSNYDESSNIVVLEIESTYSNLEDFSIKEVIRDGIESSKINFPSAQIYYFAIVDKNRKKFSFTYFDLETNSFKELFVPIIIDNQNVSTQTDINPKKNRFELYKSIMIGVFGAILLLLYVIRRKKLYLLVSIATIVYLLFFRSTFNEIVIKKNSNVKILPTKNSTVFFTTTKLTFAEKLHQIDDYVKIMLPNGQIGWIRKERVEKN